MMQHFTKLIILLLVFATQLLFAQQPSFRWGKRGGSPGSDQLYCCEQVLDMATDPNGNVYVLGQNARSLTNVDGHTGISSNDLLSLASWDCEGNFRWTKTFGSASAAFSGIGIGVDTLGGVYLAGGLSSMSSLGYAYFDADTVLGYTTKTLFFVKYDTSGTFQWLKMPQPDTVTSTTGSLSGILGVDAAPNGDIFLFGIFAPGNFDGNAFIVNERKVYVVKYNKDGTFQQLTPMDITVSGTAVQSYGYATLGGRNAHFVRDHVRGRFYLAGAYNNDFGTLTFGSTSINAIGSPGVPRMYIAAFNSTGTNLWAKQANPQFYSDPRYRPAINEQGHIFMSGDAIPGNSFGGYTFTNNLGAHTVPFLIALDTNGNNIWATHGNTMAAFPATAVAVSNNEVAVTGYYGHTFVWQHDTLTAPVIPSGIAFPYIARFNAATGQLIKMDSIRADSTLSNYPTALTADKNNNFYVGGRFGSKLYPGSSTLTKLLGGSYDWFVAKFGTDNCNCDIPQPSFTYTGGGGNTVNFTYTGSTPYTGISWDFGDSSAPANQANPAHTYSAAGSYTVCVTVSNACGSNTNCNTIQAGGSSIGNIPGFAHISLYPNPATQTITVEKAQAGTIMELYNTLGQRMLHIILMQDKEVIDVSALSAGMYLVRFTDKAGMQGTARFVKQ
jgi:PKD repeat protein